MMSVALVSKGFSAGRRVAEIHFVMLTLIFTKNFLFLSDYDCRVIARILDSVSLFVFPV